MTPNSSASPAPYPLPEVTAIQMREVDRLMVEVYGIQPLQMMENAGRATARLVRTRFLNGSTHGKRVLVLAGTGGNGGGGLAAARHLHNGGADVRVLTTRPDHEYEGAPADQLRIVRRMGIHASNSIGDAGAADAVVDAILGYGLEGGPRGPACDVIGLVNDLEAPIVSLDIPSGVDATTGEKYDPHVRADATITLALPKAGLKLARDAVGELYLADISVPPALYEYIGITVPPVFEGDDLLRLDL